MRTKALVPSPVPINQISACIGDAGTRDVGAVQVCSKPAWDTGGSVSKEEAEGEADGQCWPG